MRVQETDQSVQIALRGMQNRNFLSESARLADKNKNGIPAQYLAAFCDFENP